MRNQTKKLLSFVAAATMLASTLAVTACGDYSLGKKLDAPATDAVVSSNGGFAVEKGDYVYFINGQESYTADNKYGDVVKGSLMCITKTDLAAGKYDGAKVVVPTLVGSQNFETGIYIFGDYVYYATPTTDKNIQGQVENSWIDFKRARLDGSETMKGYYFRLSSNSANFRFVEVDGVVYCLYEEDSMLKSFNTDTKQTTVLAKGAGTFYYNEKDPVDPTVYYTMGVTYNVDSGKSSTATYNQIYSVRADATATVDAKEASYTVTGGRTYDFDKAYMEKVNEDAKKTANENKTDYEPTYDFNDYSTYPYVNLGTLVIDGIGSKCDLNYNTNTPYNNSEETNAELQGYKYTIARYDNDGVYYTRGDSSKLYYYNPTTADTTEAGKEVKANELSTTVAFDTTKASSSALMFYENGKHQYIYTADSNIYRATAGADGSVAEDIKLCAAASATLWKTEGEYLYYYASGSSSSGYQLSRIKYNGNKDNYHELLVTDEYKPVTYDYVDFASSWYLPEMVDGTLLYANAKSVGSTSYNYIYATELCATVDEIKAKNDKYNATMDYIDTELTADVGNAARYLYRTVKLNADGTYDNTQQFFVDLEEAATQYEEVNDKKVSWFTASEGEKSTFEEDVLDVLLAKDRANCEYVLESELIHMIGEVKEDDAEAMHESLKAYLPYPTIVEEEEGLAWWVITLIVVGAVLVVAAGVTVPVVLVMRKKKEQARRDAIVNAHERKKIDTTDDKSIDVYSDEPAEAPVEETPVEETPVEEAPVEEAPAEEAPVEEAPVEESDVKPE